MLKTRLSLYDGLFFLLLIGFVAFELPLLNLPFLFDELWVYGPAVQMMAEQGTSLMPNAISPDFSRGHPLLFHALYGLWITLFGDSLVAMKSLSLLISTALLVSLYVIIRKWINPKMALLGVLFLTLQPLFLAQATMVLPEMMLALFTLLTVFFYWEQDFSWKYMLAGIALVLTKESGIVIVGSVLLFSAFDFAQAAYRRRPLAERSRSQDFRMFSIIPHAFQHHWRQLVKGAVPLLLFALFLCVQKWQMNWFLFPEHIGYIDLSLKNILYNMTQKTGAYLLIYQGRNFLLFSAVLGLIWLLYRKQSLPNLRLPLLFLLMIVVFMLFSAMNFFTNRYLLCLVPLYIILVLWLIQAVFEKNIVYWVYIVLFLATQYPYLQKKDISDNTLGFVNCVKLNQELVNYCVETISPQEPVFAFFVTRYALGLHYGKYLKQEQAYQNLPTNLEPFEAKYYVISNIDCFNSRHHLISLNPSLKRLKHVENGKLWAEVYQKIE